LPHDAALEAHEHAEHAEHAAHAADPFTNRASITIAILAVMAAGAGSLETIEAGQAITASSKAVLAQDKATDDWAFYQAKSIKKNMYGIAAEQASGDHVADFKKQEAKNEADEEKIQDKAKEEEKQREEFVEQSEKHENRHHWLTGSATALEIGIAIATVAIITKKRGFWMAAVLLGLMGLVLGGLAYIL
jgi:hypothetical protein